LNGIGLFLALAVIVEALTEVTKRISDKIPTQIYTIFWGIAVCLICDADILTLIGGQSRIPFAGSILTGILMSRGSNYINDLLNLLPTYGGKSKNGVSAANGVKRIPESTK